MGRSLPLGSSHGVAHTVSVLNTGYSTDYEEVVKNYRSRSSERVLDPIYCLCVVVWFRSSREDCCFGSRCTSHLAWRDMTL